LKIISLLKVPFHFMDIIMFSDVLKKYSSIDTGLGTDKITSHSYESVYNTLFLKYKDCCKNILEIGFDGGFALQAYSEYFMNSNIYGIDIKDNRNEDIKKNPKINVFIGDACSSEAINKFNLLFDIIVEDASHLPEHQIKHFMDYNKLVNKGGIYVIEDIHENHFNEVYSKTKEIAENNDFKVEVFDLRFIKSRFDDIIIVFTKY